MAVSINDIIKNRVKQYYLEGYGHPITYYTDAQLSQFVKKGLITEEYAEELRNLKYPTIEDSDDSEIFDEADETETEQENSTDTTEDSSSETTVE